MNKRSMFSLVALAVASTAMWPSVAPADLAASPVVEASPSSPVRNKVKDDELAVFMNLNGSALYSLDDWLERSAEGLIDHPPFRAKVEQLLVELLDDPETPWHDPLLDTQIELPLFGLFNIGLHFQDIWSGVETTATTRGPCNYPNTGVYATCVKAADRFDDPATSHTPININWSQVHAIISPQSGTMGTASNLPVTTAATPTFADGAINITLTLGDVYLDTILRKPDFPADPTSFGDGHYIHALGRLRIVGPTTLSVKIFTIGGKFAGSTAGSFISGGYGIGIDFQSITFSGGLQLDLDEFDCTYNRGNTSDLGTLHPDWAYQWARDDEGMCFLRSDHTTTTGGACFSTKSTGADLAAPNKDASCTGAVASPWKYYIDYQGTGVGPEFDAVHPDLEVAECDGADGTIPNGACTIPAPAAGAFAAAPEILAAHRNKTNERSDYIGEIIQFLEGQVFLDMQQNSLPAAVKSYLTALEITDTTWLTHERDADSISNPILLEHPIETGNNMLIDYGFFYRFAAVNSGGQMGAFIPGGFAAAVTQYNNPLPHCATVPGATLSAPVNVAHDRIEHNSLWTSPMGYGSTAMIGLSVQANPINNLLDNVWRSKILCMNLWSGSGMVGSLLEDILTVNQFSMFMPSLLTSLGDNEMAIRLRPRYTKPSTPLVYSSANDQPQVTWEPGDPINLLNPATTGYWDVKIALPHLETIFAVDAKTTGQTYYVKNFTDVFSADVSMHAYLDAAWYTLTAAGWASNETGDQCKIQPYPCRIARLGFHLDAYVNEIDQSSYPGRVTAIEPDDLTGSLSSLLALVLAGEYEGNLEVHLNTNPTNISFLGVVIDPVLPGSTGVNGPDAGLGGLNSDGTGGNDYFGGYFKVADLGPDPDGAGPLIGDGYSDALDPQMITDLLTDAGILPEAPGLDRPVGYDPFEKYRTGYSGPQKTAPETMVRMINDAGVVFVGDSLELTAAQTRAMGIGPRGGSIYLASDSIDTAPENLIVQYQVDRGLYSLPMRTNRVDLPYQFDGRHTLQIWSSDERGVIDSTPAVIKYIVDTQAPRLKWMSDAIVRADAYRRELSVRDAVSALDAIELSYRVDGGEWAALAGSQELYIDSLSDGSHTIEVLAVDESGNESILSDAIYVAEGQGFGCAATGASAASTASFLGMLLLFFAGYTGLRWYGRARQ